MKMDKETKKKKITIYQVASKYPETERDTHTETERHRDREQRGWGERAVNASLPRTRPSAWPWARPAPSFSVLGLVCSHLPWGTEDRGACHSEGIRDHPTHHIPSWRRETGSGNYGQV